MLDADTGKLLQQSPIYIRIMPKERGLLSPPPSMSAISLGNLAGLAGPQVLDAPDAKVSSLIDYFATILDFHALPTDAVSEGIPNIVLRAHVRVNTGRPLVGSEA